MSGSARSSRNCSVIVLADARRRCPKIRCCSGLEDVEQVAASNDAEIETANPADQASRATKRRMNRGSLPAHLPRIEMVVDIEDHNCPCCGQALHRIGEDTGKRLDIVPAQFRVLVVRRPKYTVARTWLCRRPRRRG
jgi:transposase